MFGWLDLQKRKEFVEESEESKRGQEMRNFGWYFLSCLCTTFSAVVFSYIHRPVLSQPGIWFPIPSFEPAHPAAFCHKEIRYRMYRLTGRG